ncbi:MAG: NBR1-Ig-like domain-containing protein [Anaerolineales bacterium]
MRNKKNTKIFVVCVFFLITSCGAPFTPAAPTPTLVNPFPPEVLNGIIQQTSEAAQTQTAISLPTSTATATITPTPTITPTFTPTFIFHVGPSETSTLSPSEFSTLSAASIAGTLPSGTLTIFDKIATAKAESRIWSCVILEKSQSRVSPGEKFYVTWIVKNNGSKTWTNNGVDFVYVSGYRTDERHIQDLPKTIEPNHTITLRVHVVAPKQEGTYNLIWSLQVGRGLFCHMKNTFVVAK